MSTLKNITGLLMLWLAGALFEIAVRLIDDDALAAALTPLVEHLSAMTGDLSPSTTGTERSEVSSNTTQGPRP